MNLVTRIITCEEDILFHTLKEFVFKKVFQRLYYALGNRKGGKCFL